LSAHLHSALIQGHPPDLLVVSSGLIDGRYYGEHRDNQDAASVGRILLIKEDSTGSYLEYEKGI